MSARPELPSGTVTFLFTDIEGSTGLLKRLGRDGYESVLAQHAGILRATVAVHDGQVVDTQGDSFFAAFRAAREAVSAAVEAQRELAAAEWPEGVEVRVRMGLHSGEPKASGERYVGIGVHRAARVGGVAHGGQVLLSETTRALVEEDLPDDVSLRDLGPFRLKDIDRPERISQVVAEGLPSEFPPLRGAEPVKSQPVLRRRSVLAAALVGVIAAAVAIPLFALGSGGSDGSTTLASVSANSVGVLDARDGKIVSQLRVGGAPSGVSAGTRAIWVTANDGTVSRVDPVSSGGVREAVPVGSEPSGVAVVRGFIWVANTQDGTVSRIDGQTNRPVGESINVGNGPVQVAGGGGSVWVANELDGTVSRIDPDNGTVVKTYSAGRYASGVAFGAGSLWVADESSDSVLRIDPRSGATTQEIQVGGGPRQLVFGTGSLWAANSLDGTVSRVDPQTNKEAAKITVGDGPSGIAVGSGAVWVSVRFAEKVVRMDPKTNAVSMTIPIGNRPLGISADRRHVFVAVRSSGVSHRGGTLTVLNMPLSDYPVEGAFGGQSNSIVAYKRVGGVESLQLAPDLATALPAPTDQGTTYTFQLRRGIRYSNGQQLRPEDVRHSIERAFRLNGPHGVYFGLIVGSEACANRPKTCDLSKGIVADDRANTVTFHLTRPDPYFLYNVPISLTPASIPDQIVDPKALPVTGPYKVVSYRPDREAILVRNPYFHVWSQAAQPNGFPSRIVEKYNIPDAEAVRMVERGQADIVPVPDQLTAQLAARYPSQLQTSPRLATGYLFLNTRQPPFDDVRVRQALNYAIDRKQFANVGSHLTCQILPPNFPGYRPYCPYTVGRSPAGAWLGPDLTRARQLISASHTKGMQVTVWWGKEFGNRAKARQLVSVLKQLGYRARLKLVPVAKYFPAIADPRSKAQIGYTGWSADYAGASDFIYNNFSCTTVGNSNGNTSEFCDPTIDREIKRAQALDTTDPGAANLLWARIDHQIVDNAPVVPLQNPTQAFLVSKRIGNFQVGGPGSVPLLDQLWVR